MKKSINKYLYTLILLSTNLLAMGGPHIGLTAGAGSSDNGQICVYCHTPHAANDFASQVTVPLWNKPVTNVSFKMYGASVRGVPGVTMAGTPTDATPTDTSLACLSCHDGVTAMNSAVNAPGSGGINPIGSLIGSPTPVWMGVNDVKAVGANYTTKESGDLTDDHPISVVYTPGRAGLRPTETALDNFVGAETVSDLLRDGKVQCSSCHDPHEYSNGIYLRKFNGGSSLCLGCHNK
ncbi:cytochrome C [Candidatus Sulfurimonas marisnigri]|uniref:Cytochrome C n=1 Tax=Candidatus Sulfurimonas marisnigri TaxID=2740405 RepID=A0A7S7M082_9BACT|nr:cytochrome c3 family protein [Candidatus Sulfurimonas marisnigri]QOY54646.1 cytochrome C [Candidatus Sulfurimonas marisnigri]